jgi:hypothetical protein
MATAYDDLQKLKAAPLNCFFFSDGIAGSGKTHKAIGTACKRAELGDNVMIAQPTIKLIDETYTNSQFDKLRAHKKLTRHYQNCPEYEDKTTTVQSHIRTAMGTRPTGEVLILTHASLLNIPFVPKGTWHLIIDEMIDPTHGIKIPVATEEHRNEICNALTFSKSNENEDYHLVSWNARMAEMRDNKRDDIFWETPKLQDLTAFISNPHWQMWVAKKEHDEFANRTRNDLTFYGLLQPSILDDFKTVTFLAADIEYSKLKFIWGTRGISFERSKSIQPRQVQTDPTRVEIIYAMDEPWSKYRAGLTTKQGKTIHDALLEACEKIFGDKPYLFVDNNSMAETPSNAKRIPVVSHGLNSYQHIHDIAFIPALNPNPNVDAFLLKVCGMDPNDIYITQTLTVAYQDVMRTSLRDPHSSSKVRIFTPSRDLGSRLQAAFFPDCTLTKMDSSTFDVEYAKRGRKPKPDAIATKERIAFHRAKKALEATLAGNSCNGNSISVTCNENSCNENSLYTHYKGISVTSISVTNPKVAPNQSVFVSRHQSLPISAENAGSFDVEYAKRGRKPKPDAIATKERVASHRAKKALEANKGISVTNPKVAPNQSVFVSRHQSLPISAENAGSFEEHLGFLNEAHKSKYLKKEDNYLISPASFDPTLAEETNRGKDNVTHLDCVWIDNDGACDMTYQDFAEIFPYWEMHFWNTWSSGESETTGQPNRRWHVLLPVSRKLTVGEHDSIIQYVLALLRQKKLYGRKHHQDNPKSKIHGFDETKFNEAAMFYLPCQSNFGDTFYEGFSEGRQPINPDMVPKAPVAAGSTRSTAVVQSNASIDQAFLDKRLQELLATPRGTQRAMLFGYSTTLKNQGVPPADAEVLLRQAASQLLNPTERLAEVSELMKKY